MKKIILLAAALLMFAPQSRADEGMWLLTTLKSLNIKDMQQKGLKLSADDIYNVNKHSLKDAIVIFGNGCTGEIVSSQGLLFTNHHCGYGNIQSLSSVEHDYLKNGFWAMNHGEELPAPGLSVKFIRHIEDVTAKLLKGVDDTMVSPVRDELIAANTKAVQEEWENNKKYAGMTVAVQSFFGGNQFLLFCIEEYKDVRLVGAPPSSIGKFGGETDNWMWPRHTGDFSIFRVYSDKEGKPSEYSKDNVPYKAPVHLKVSMKGVKEGDFAMIMGFPGSTDRYMTSYEIDQTLEVDNPNRIYIRGERQDVLKKLMADSDEIRIKYAAKYAQSSNYWKNSIGMSRGLKKLNVKAQKEAEQDRFRKWVAADPARAKYAQALPLIEEAVAGRTPHMHVLQYLMETVMRGVDITSATRFAARLEDPDKFGGIEKIREEAAAFYKDYDENTDKLVAAVMFRVLGEGLEKDKLPSVYKTIESEFGGDYAKYVAYLYDNSAFANVDKFNKLLDMGDFSKVSEDPAVILRNSVIEVYNAEVPPVIEFEQKFATGHRLYIAGLLEMEKDVAHYPDANFTIRLTYGNVLPYSPADAVMYNYYTTLSGVMAKEDPSNPVEFTVPDKLKQLYQTKDFGPYAENGDVPVAFLTNNDITGGNSGSPVLNGHGELIGLAFDGNWEAMSGDIAFEPDLQRCINVDVRYVLFIIDKFAGAKHLVDELTLVK